MPPRLFTAYCSVAPSGFQVSGSPFNPSVAVSLYDSYSQVISAGDDSTVKVEVSVVWPAAAQYPAIASAANSRCPGSLASTEPQHPCWKVLTWRRGPLLCHAVPNRLRAAQLSLGSPPP